MNNINILEESLAEQIQGKKVVIWGTGECAIQFIERNPWIQEKIKYFVDKDEKKYTTYFYEKKVYSLEKLLKEKEDVCCLLASQYFTYMLKELENHHFSGLIFNIFYMNYRNDGWMDTKKLDSHYDEVEKILSDEKSKQVVDFIRNSRKSFNVDYTTIQEENQYFIKELIRIEENAVFVDGGAYDGDTTEEFLAFQSGIYESVYCFEMDYYNYEKLKKNMNDKENVHVLNYGLWDKEMEMKYSSNNTFSSISVSGDGNMTAKCVSLDEILNGQRVSFIKMDIEGAEICALYGAKKSIMQWKPQLAICIYHKPDDLWQIPLLIHEWVPEYKLYIRHHSNIFTETVLYAVL